MDVKLASSRNRASRNYIGVPIAVWSDADVVRLLSISGKSCKPTAGTAILFVVSELGWTIVLTPIVVHIETGKDTLGEDVSRKAIARGPSSCGRVYEITC